MAEGLRMETVLPRITVVTVTYNPGLLLEKTIQSVIGQDYPNIEYLIIDGGSRDGTVEMIKKYEKNLAYWVSEPDRGIYDAMNKGIRQASGEWINFMNAGDLFASLDTVSTFIEKVQKDTEIAYGASFLVHPITKEKTYHPVHALEALYTPEMPFIHQSVFIRSNIMKRYGYREDYVYASDFDFFLLAYQNGHRYQYLEDLTVSEFLGGGLHAYHMPQYMAECINSLVQHHEDPRDFARMRGVADACRWFYAEKKIEFSRAFGLLSMQLEKLKEEYSRIVVYGYGSVGQIAAQKLHPLAVVDRAVGEGEKEGYRFIGLDDFTRLDYDAVVITVLGREAEIMRDLIRHGVPEGKIIPLEI